MAVVPRNLGLVAALAVSGTALYLVFGYKRKKVVVNVRRGKETWRLEYLHGGSAIQQQQQQQQQKAGSKQESGVRLELHEGKDIAISEIQLQQLPWLRRVIRRLPLQPLLLPPAAGPADDLLPNGSLRRKGALEKRMVNCEGNAAQLTVFQDTLSSFEVEEQQQQQLSESVADFFTFVSSAGGASQSDILGRRDGRSKDASSPSCAEDDCCSEASLSSTASPASSPNSRALVGCFIVPGAHLLCALSLYFSRRYYVPENSASEALLPLSFRLSLLISSPHGR